MSTEIVKPASRQDVTVFAPDAAHNSFVPVVAKAHVASLDGLRGLACLIVVLHHGWFEAGQYGFLELRLRDIVITRSCFLDKLNVGVDLFFALSGCCLALPFFNKKNPKSDWPKYFYRRCLRILPPFWICVSVLFVAHVAIEKIPISSLSGRLLTLPSFRQLGYTYALISLSLNGSFWTLLVEWRWYFVLPPLLIVWQRFGGLVVGMLSVAVAMGIYVPWEYGSGRIKFFLTPLPILFPMFAAGVWVADMSSGRPLRTVEKIIVRHCATGLAIGTFLWLISPISGVQDWTFWFTRVLTRTPFAFFALLAAIRLPRVERFLSWRPFVFLGLFSYSLYLTHAPIIQAVYIVSRSEAWSTFWKLAFFEGPVVGLTLVCGYAFYLVAERPFLRRRPA